MSAWLLALRPLIVLAVLLLAAVAVWWPRPGR
jgi:hypothetical protein